MYQDTRTFGLGAIDNSEAYHKFVLLKKAGTYDAI